jgi:ATP-dependent exoDNAse (exonuclease V) alpha subunit
LQSNNPNPPVVWDMLVYKIGDPILFNESKRFMPVIHNNLKGKIVDIGVEEDKIRFDIEIDKAINEFEIFCLDLELIATTEDRKSIVRFYVNKLKTTDEDDTSSKAVVPFQVAYAVSIHKSQGLEYNSVRIIITTEVEELITHNIFYTAITRAKNKLKIYWTPEAQSKVIKNLKHTVNMRDAGLIASKYNLKRIKR